MAYRILVADDSSTIQKVIKIALATFDINIFEASSTVEALRNVSDHKMDALILDASLPGAKQASDLREIVERAGGTPAIVLIGSYEDVDEDDLRNNGFERILRKPFESKDIVNEVKLCIGDDLSSPPVTHAGPASFSTSDDEDTIASEAPSAGVVSGVPEPVFSPSIEPEIGLMDSVLPDIQGLNPQMGQDEDSTLAATNLQNPEEVRGTKAFQEDSSRDSLQLGGKPIDIPSFQSEPVKAAAAGPQMDEARLKELINQRIASELPGSIRQAVEEFCSKHFAEIAREILTSELRRLAEERTRYLVD